MASVKYELRNEGKGLHEWDYVPLSEARNVKMQIQERSKLDPTYGMKLYECSPLLSQGVAPMSEPITVTYLDQDRLIDTCGLTKAEQNVVELLMMGYTKADICDEYSCRPQFITDMFNAAVEKIVDKNDYDWFHTTRFS